MAHDWQVNGGPAFPAEFVSGDGTKWSYRGMTLRDWLAGQVVSSFLNIIIENCIASDDDTSVKLAASKSYALADAMLEERKNK